MHSWRWMKSNYRKSILFALTMLLYLSCSSSAHYLNVEEDSREVSRYDSKIERLSREIDSLGALISQGAGGPSLEAELDSLILARRKFEHRREKSRRSAIENARQGNEMNPIYRSKED